MWMLLTAFALIAASGVPGMMSRRHALATARGSVGMVLAGSGLALASGWQVLAATRFFGSVTLPFSVATLRWAVDPLGAFFVLPICVVGAAGAFYGLKYWDPQHHPRSSATVRLFYGWLIASMGMVVLAADGISFIVAYEVMSLSAFGLISAEHHRATVRQAGWLYLVATHVSILALMALLALWHAATGSFAFVPLEAGAAGPGVRTVMFLLALVAFGCKAGMMPLHFWLPHAHAHAPSHVSALLSGVVIKMGIYGLLRFALVLLPGPPLSWGVIVLALGTISAVLGVAFAIAQHDLKRLLAYHSVENIGIILMGLGIALIGAATHEAGWVAIGLAGCLLHVWNHGLFKSLLFMAAGAVIGKAHTREIDRMGGLAKGMPLTAGAFLLGAAAICGLPPLNGFVSEFLVYMGLLAPMNGAAPKDYAVLALAAPALALVGALALACFVKAYGAVFLGLPRRGIVAGRDAGWVMLVPMAVLGICCVSLGVFPAIGVAATRVVAMRNAGVSGEAATGALAPVAALGAWLPIVAGVLAVGFAGFWVWIKRRDIQPAATWGCGYTRPTARVQYTASSFAASIVGLFRWVLRPQAARVQLAEWFPKGSHFVSHVGDLVLDGCLAPVWSGIKRRVVDRRGVRQGNIQWYLASIVLTLIVLLLTLVPWEQMWQWVLSRG
jgi:hydrogenase-4 component B